MSAATMDADRLDVIECSAMELLPVRATFEDTYRREFPGLLAVASVFTGDPRDGEDLVQDTMVKAYLRWDRVGRLHRPGGWCHHVLINECRSWWRARRRAARFLASRRAADVAATPGPSPDAIAFWAAVRTLPERPRSVVALHYAGDLSLVEVAAVLGIPEGTARSDLSRARAVVMRALDGAR